MWLVECRINSPTSGDADEKGFFSAAAALHALVDGGDEAVEVSGGAATFTHAAVLLQHGAEVRVGIREGGGRARRWRRGEAVAAALPDGRREVGHFSFRDFRVGRRRLRWRPWRRRVVCCVCAYSTTRRRVRCSRCTTACPWDRSV